MLLVTAFVALAAVTAAAEVPCAARDSLEACVGLDDACAWSESACVPWEVRYRKHPTYSPRRYRHDPEGCLHAHPGRVWDPVSRTCIPDPVLACRHAEVVANHTACRRTRGCAWDAASESCAWRDGVHLGRLCTADSGRDVGACAASKRHWIAAAMAAFCDTGADAPASGDAGDGGAESPPSMGAWSSCPWWDYRRCVRQCLGDLRREHCRVNHNVRHGSACVPSSCGVLGGASAEDCAVFPFCEWNGASCGVRASTPPPPKHVSALTTAAPSGALPAATQSPLTVSVRPNGTVHVDTEPNHEAGTAAFVVWSVVLGLLAVALFYWCLHRAVPWPRDQRRKRL